MIIDAAIKKQALQLIDEGYSAADVARSLDISEKTVRTWRKAKAVDFEAAIRKTQKKIQILNPIIAERGTLPKNQPLYVLVTEDEHDRLVDTGAPYATKTQAANHNRRPQHA